jgi:hypothetical protein
MIVIQIRYILLFMDMLINKIINICQFIIGASFSYLNHKLKLKKIVNLNNWYIIFEYFTMFSNPGLNIYASNKAP